MSTVTSFIRKYAAEAGAVAKGMAALLEGVAISPKNAADVIDAVTKLETAAANLADYSEPTIKISKTDIKAAIVEYLESEEGKAFLAKALTIKETDRPSKFEE